MYELLGTGKENAVSGRELAAILHINIRNVTEQIEKERRAGQPICATASGENPGYYLAKDDEELQGYCNALRKRAGELFKTRRALMQINLDEAEPMKTDNKDFTFNGESIGEVNWDSLGEVDTSANPELKL